MQLRERDCYFDNLKGCLILLVVFGHLLEPFLATGASSIRLVYLAIYAFHMPLFAFCSGWFSTGLTPQKLVHNVLYPYAVWQSIYCIFYRTALGSSDMELHYATPVWVMWYLLSAFFWGLMLPLFRSERRRGAALALICAAAMGLLAGFFNEIGYYLSLSRTLVFFPFYLCGYYGHTYKAALPGKKALAPAAVLAALGLGALVWRRDFDATHFYESCGYAQLGGSLFIRLFHYVLAAALSVLVMALTPRRPTLLSRLGQRSMQIFLLHGLLVSWLSQRWLSRLPWLPSPYIILACALAGALALCLLLGSPPVTWLLRPLLRLPVRSAAVPAGSGLSPHE